METLICHRLPSGHAHRRRSINTVKWINKGRMIYDEADYLVCMCTWMEKKPDRLEGEHRLWTQRSLGLILAPRSLIYQISENKLKYLSFSVFIFRLELTWSVLQYCFEEKIRHAWDHLTKNTIFIRHQIDVPSLSCRAAHWGRQTFA